MAQVKTNPPTTANEGSAYPMRPRAPLGVAEGWEVLRQPETQMEDQSEAKYRGPLEAAPDASRRDAG